jgi:hypothetical protein
VALSGDTALVGAENRAAAGVSYAGAAYVFTRSGGAWTQQAELTAADATSRAGFGSALALDGDTALVGAGGATVGGRLNAGAAYVFTRSDGAWSQQAELTDPGAAAGDWFGAALALDGDAALVGAWGTTVAGRSEAGAAYVYRRAEGAWSPRAAVTVSDAAYGDNLGSSVALSGSTTLAGACFKTVAGQAQVGAAYVHILVPAPSVSLAASPHTTRVGRPVSLTGEVTNVVGGRRTVRIVRKQGGRLVRLASLRVAATGEFAWSMPVARAGTWVLAATYEVGGANFQSPAVRVVVHKKHKKPPGHKQTGPAPVHGR